MDDPAPAKAPVGRNVTPTAAREGVASLANHRDERLHHVDRVRAVDSTVTAATVPTVRRPRARSASRPAARPGVGALTGNARDRGRADRHRPQVMCVIRIDPTFATSCRPIVRPAPSLAVLRGFTASPSRRQRGPSRRCPPAPAQAALPMPRRPPRDRRRRKRFRLRALQWALQLARNSLNRKRPY